MQEIIAQSSTRIKTGIALLLAFVVMGYINTLFLTWFVFGLLMMIGLNEAMRLFKIDDGMIYLYAIAIWIMAYFYPKPEDLVFVVGVVFASILAYTKQFNTKLFIPLMYPIVSFLFLLSLYISFDMESLLWLVAIVAGADIGAYFVGKQIGSTKFCQTSPNKTLEGVFGGILVASVLGMIFSPQYVGFVVGFFISFVVAIASVFGDLFESYLKREADVKDSGDILPGHGGILDRSDGYLFGGIILLVMLRLFY